MTNTTELNAKHGLILHAAAAYDFLLWIVTLGREQAFREKLLKLARLNPGESVLDVGCGTGTLAIAAKRQVGTNGRVNGIDASPNMIARAVRKAKKAGVNVVFQNAIVQALPFPDSEFDVVLSTVMLHHLPRNTRQQCAREIRRVLKPSGRILIVDFGASDKNNFLSHFHRHGSVPLAEIIDLLNGADLNIVDSGPVGINNLQFVLGATSHAA